MELEENEFRRV
jgi:hypothetical protein